MSENRLYQTALDNSNVFSGADYNVTGGVVTIKGIRKFQQKDFLGFTKTVPAVEVIQVKDYFRTTKPTIVAGGRYGFQIGNIQDRTESRQNQLKPVSAAAPPVLSGTAATDRYNVYVRLAQVVNQDKSLRVNAYPIVQFDVVTPGNATLNQDITISGVPVGFVTSIVGSTLQVALYQNGYLAAPNFATASIDGPGGTLGTVSALALDVALRFIDKGPYYGPKGQPAGATTIIGRYLVDEMLYGQIVTAPVYSRGIGSRMALDVPVKELLSDNLSRGRWEMPVNEPVNPAFQYVTYTGQFRIRTGNHLQLDSVAETIITFLIFVNADNTNTKITQLDAFFASI